MELAAGALAGIRVLDLSRILAGPSCTQLLGDLGADVIKVERPGHGDDTRSWGPPFLSGPEGPRAESAYYACANRNKRSIAIDFTHRDGAALIHRLAESCDVLIENHRVGSLARYGLDATSMREAQPRLIYCSITGFGQTGPRATQPGYDFLAQAMSGVMSITGEAGGAPMKVGVGIADLMCGMYAAVAILAALRHRETSGKGQTIDLSLFDSTLAWLANRGSNYLVSGQQPRRWGNAHPNIVPYETFPTADGWVVIACGNDTQFARLCDGLQLNGVSGDPRFSTNQARLENRDAVVERIAAATLRETTSHWVAILEKHRVPGGAVMSVAEALADPQTQARDMLARLERSPAESYTFVANPIRLDQTPVSYRRSPPALGEHTGEVLAEELGLDPDALASLRERDVIG
ncbi:MAG: CaiB/BaiF CoA-transferase family protein [Myxococcota bacterium]